MLVALSMRVTEAPNYAEPRDAISHDWVKQLAEWNMTPLLLPNHGPLETMLERFAPDLIVLTGGDDLGEMPDRDAAERRLLGHAVAHKSPLLGVCRGMQLVNDWFDGVSTEIEGHVATRHVVDFDPAWSGIYGESSEVNSYHRTGVRRQDLGKSLVATAHDSVGNIEAFTHFELPVAAVMWHPERQGAPSGGDEKMLRTLAARGRAK